MPKNYLNYKTYRGGNLFVDVEKIVIGIQLCDKVGFELTVDGIELVSTINTYFDVLVSDMRKYTPTALFPSHIDNRRFAIPVHRIISMESFDDDDDRTTFIYYDSGKKGVHMIIANQSVELSVDCVRVAEEHYRRNSLR